MKIIITQSCKEIENKLIAFATSKIIHGGFDYPIMFDKNTKKRFNAFLKKEGFIIGEVNYIPPEKEIILKGE